jgi:hypothetical protein
MGFKEREAVWFNAQRAKWHAELDWHHAFRNELFGNYEPFDDVVGRENTSIAAAGLIGAIAVAVIVFFSPKKEEKKTFKKHPFLTRLY